MTDINASDVTARAYGVRPRSYRVLTETVGLALVVLINRNTAPERAMWLVNPVVSDVLCEAAEAFVKVLEQRPPVDGWRGGALASLRSLVPGTVHETQDRWPNHCAVTRVWLDDQDDYASRWDRPPMPPVRAELTRRLRGRDDLDRALSALVGNYRSHGGQLAVWDSFHESPANTRQLLRDDLLGQHPGSPAHQQTRDRAGTNQ